MTLPMTGDACSTLRTGLTPVIVESTPSYETFRDVWPVDRRESANSALPLAAVPGACGDEYDGCCGVTLVRPGVLATRPGVMVVGAVVRWWDDDDDSSAGLPAVPDHPAAGGDECVCEGVRGLAAWLGVRCSISASVGIRRGSSCAGDFSRNSWNEAMCSWYCCCTAAVRLVEALARTAEPGVCVASGLGDR